jgi:uncharacterized protein (DUF849 family)
VGQRLVVQVTTESGRIYSPPAQMALVRELHPEAVSVALRELLPADAPQDEALAFLTWLAGSGIMAQVILYDVEDLRRWQALRARGDIPEAPWFLLFVLGRYSAGQRSQPADLLPFVQAHTGPEPWAVCAFGAQENACLLTAAALGGHARMGFENNLLLPDGSTAPDNAALVRLAAQGAPLIGRPGQRRPGARALPAPLTRTQAPRPPQSKGRSQPDMARGVVASAIAPRIGIPAARATCRGRRLPAHPRRPFDPTHRWILVP